MVIIYKAGYSEESGLVTEPVAKREVVENKSAPAEVYIHEPIIKSNPQEEIFLQTKTALQNAELSAVGADAANNRNRVRPPEDRATDDLPENTAGADSQNNVSGPRIRRVVPTNADRAKAEIDSALRAVCSVDEQGKGICETCPYRDHFFTGGELQISAK